MSIGTSLDYSGTNADDDWPNQVKAVEGTLSLFEKGTRRVAITSPTGTGKSRIVARLVQWANKNNLPVSIYCTRNLLVSQMSKDLSAFGIDHGIRAASFPGQLALLKNVQISIDATERSRVLSPKRKKPWDVHNAKLIIVDEAHMQKGETFRKLMELHEGNSPFRVGLTATPIGIGDLYDELLIACNNSEARGYGALDRCRVFAPDELDASAMKPVSSTGEYKVDKEAQKKWITRVIGRVIENYKRLNPDGLPTILFAPGIRESMWFVDQFEQAGISACHIDGEDAYTHRRKGVYFGEGKGYRSSKEIREELISMVRSGEIKVMCNRFVMREGIDIKELYHGIFACVFGSLTSYLQAVGRILRSHPDVDHCILQDHGGNYWRHGSPNADLNWNVVWQMDEPKLNRMKSMTIKHREEDEPVVCQKCNAVRHMGKRCQNCGHYQVGYFRNVWQSNGDLREVTTPAVTQYEPKLAKGGRTVTEKQWEKIYFRMKNAKSPRTFSQALGLFKHEHYYSPPTDLPRMPRRLVDWMKHINDVPPEDLH